MGPRSNPWGAAGDAAVGWPDATTNTDAPLACGCGTTTHDITRAFKIRLNKAWAVDYGSSSDTGGPLAAAATSA